MDEIWKEKYYSKISKLVDGRLSLRYGEKICLNSLNNVVYFPLCFIDSFWNILDSYGAYDLLLG
jgi:hypothetical protein